MSSLSDFGIHTDKAWGHQYLHYYESLFHPIRKKVKTVLEIGIWYGGSLLMWRDYFDKATIYGIDIADHGEEMDKQERINARYMEAYSQEAVDSFGDLTFDIIIDDGPHTLDSQKFASSFYTKLLKPNGIFVIEDIPDPEWIPQLTEALPEELRPYSYGVDRRWVPDKQSLNDEIMFVVDKRFI